MTVKEYEFLPGENYGIAGLSGYFCFGSGDTIMKEIRKQSRIWKRKYKDQYEELERRVGQSRNPRLAEEMQMRLAEAKEKLNSFIPFQKREIVDSWTISQGTIALKVEGLERGEYWDIDEYTGKPLEKIKLSNDGARRLMQAVGVQAATEYKKALKDKRECRRGWNCSTCTNDLRCISTIEEVEMFYKSPLFEAAFPNLDGDWITSRLEEESY